MVERSAVQARWEQYRDALHDELFSAEAVTFCIPGWEPAGVDQGYRWLQASIYEGFQVSHQIDWANKAATVVFSISED
jgi:hypothetical protein